MRPFVDRPITDRSAADRAAIEAAAHWGLAEPTLLRVGMNAIYLASEASDDPAGEIVLRVSAPSAPAEAALELAMFLSDQGLRVPQPRRLSAFVAGDLAVTGWERIASVGDSTDWEAVGEMVRTVHGLDPSQLPSAYPLGSPASFAWWDFDALLGEVGDDIDAAARAGLDAAIERHRGWSRFDGELVCHGDVHPGNVMMTADGPALIDWDLLCWAPAGWDHGPMMTWHERWGGAAGEYDAFASGYGASLRGDPSAEAFAELRLVAATLMRVRAARQDPAARSEADRR
ncbi:MAG: aminoglycoside phosphotransferase family protein, partial [Ilumatobacteraceae bacterium]